MGQSSWETEEDLSLTKYSSPATMWKSLPVRNEETESDSSVKVNKHQGEFKPSLQAGLDFPAHNVAETSLVSLTGTKPTALSAWKDLNPNETEVFNYIKMGVETVLKCILCY